MAGLVGRWLKAAVATSIVSIAHCAAAEPVPSWELGLGIGVIGFGDYRGSDVSHVYPVPVPYAVYRGKILKSDQNGVRGELFKQAYVDFSASVNATTPVSSGNAVRRGMPDLKPTVEIGPSMNVHLWSSGDRRIRWSVRTAVRDAIAVESAPHSIGWFASPTLNLDLAAPFSMTGWNLGLMAGPSFANQRYHDYFYGVARRYATERRPAYEASGGYSGTQLLAALSKRYPRFWIGAFLRHDWLAGAVFDDSPLVRQEDYWSGGIGIAWIIGQSAHVVDSEDEGL